ncbi:MAG: efflux RND transporter periplasmic adaptor subunit [Rhizobiales bacterium]|nr:efflux RND transporter periplasmic adaptor subunit [Hyphomicrobiales bacterium]
MTQNRAVLLLSLLLAGAALAGYGYVQRSGSAATQLSVAPRAAAAERTILYYRDPSGAPNWSALPKNDAQGRAFLPVYDDAEPSFDPPKPPKPAGDRKILFYRNPMGLPDTSPVPKKDSMGMDYIAVYDGDAPSDGKTIKVSVERVQRSGVRTEPAEARVLTRPVRAVGTVAIDERRATIVTMRSDGYVEDLFVNTTGQIVRAGEPLFRVYSPDIQQAFSDLLVAKSWSGTANVGLGKSLEGAMQRLRNLGVPEARIREIRDSGSNPRIIDWLAPAGGTVMVKRVINGQKIVAGDELYRIVDLTNVWVIADVAEGDLAEIKLGDRATVTFRAYRNQPVEGKVTFIYPEVKTETRTVRVRIEVANPDERLKPDMYADVTFLADADHGAVTTVPVSAIIDNGKQQIVLVSKGEGRFEPRPVKLGRRGDGYVEIVEGLKPGEDIVTTATFLIDAESNLQSALKTFTDPEQPK